MSDADVRARGGMTDVNGIWWDIVLNDGNYSHYFDSEVYNATRKQLHRLDEMRRIGQQFNFYSTLTFLVPFGLLGNVFSVVVFASASNFRRTSTVQYLIALAGADSVYLVGEALLVLLLYSPRGLLARFLVFHRAADVFCQGVTWSQYRFVYSYRTVTVGAGL